MVFNYTENEDGKFKKTVLKPENYAQFCLLAEEVIDYIKCMAAGISPPWKNLKGEDRVKVRDQTRNTLKSLPAGKKLHPSMPMFLWFTKTIMQVKILQKNAKLICKRKGDLTAIVLKRADVKGNGEYINANMSNFLGIKDRGFPADVYSTSMALSAFSIYFRLFNLKHQEMPKEYEDQEGDSNTVQAKKATLRKNFKKSDYVKLDTNLYNLINTIRDYSVKYKGPDGTDVEVDVDNQEMLPRITLTSKIFTLFKTREVNPKTGDPTGPIVKVPINQEVKDCLREERYLLKSIKEHLDILDYHNDNNETHDAKKVFTKLRELCDQYGFPIPPSSLTSDDGFKFTNALSHIDANAGTRLVKEE